MEILSGAGGGALAVLQHVFPVALVGVAAGCADGDGPAPIFCGDSLSGHAAMKNRRKTAQFDKSETLEDRF